MFLGQMRKEMRELFGELGKKLEEIFELLKEERRGLSEKIDNLTREIKELHREMVRLNETVKSLLQQEKGVVALFFDMDYTLSATRRELANWRVPFPELMKAIGQKYGRVDVAKSFGKFVPETLQWILKRAGVEITLCPPLWEGEKETTDETIVEEATKLPSGSTLLLVSGDKDLITKTRTIIEKKGGKFEFLAFDTLTSPPSLRGKEIVIPLYQKYPEEEKSKAEIFWERVFRNLVDGHRSFTPSEEFLLFLLSRILEILPPSPFPQADQPLRTRTNLAELLFADYYGYHPKEEKFSYLDVQVILQILINNEILREKKEEGLTYLYHIPFKDWPGKLKDYLRFPKE